VADLFEIGEESGGTGGFVVFICVPVPVAGYCLDEGGFCLGKLSGNVKSGFSVGEAAFQFWQQAFVWGNELDG
jgi:hypothetical protein